MGPKQTEGGGNLHEKGGAEKEKKVGAVMIKGRERTSFQTRLNIRGWKLPIEDSPRQKQNMSGQGTQMWMEFGTGEGETYGLIGDKETKRGKKCETQSPLKTYGSSRRTGGALGRPRKYGGKKGGMRYRKRK